jgi:hypothetical protein
MKLLTIRNSFFSILLSFVCLTTYAQHWEGEKLLFDGKTLKGWKTIDVAEMSLWTVKDSAITSGDGINKIPHNRFLYTSQEFENFEFRCMFRLTGDASTGLINSGIQYRSFIKNKQIVGYQADIGDGYWGDVYDEHRRGKLVGGQLASLLQVLNKNGWNSYIIRCQGDRHELYINGVKTSEYIEKDTTIPRKGVIGLQLHSGGNGIIEMKDIVIREL